MHVEEGFSEYKREEKWQKEKYEGWRPQLQRQTGRMFLIFASQDLYYVLDY